MAVVLSGCGGGPAATRPPTVQPTAAAKMAATGAATGSRPRDLETYLVLIDLGVYRSKVAPAFEKYIESGDASAVSGLMPGAKLPALAERKKRLEAALELAPTVVETKCLVKLAGIEPYQLGGTELVSYLYSASDWLRETLTSKDISDVTLEYPLGEHTEIIRATDAAEIRVNARNVPAPEDAKIKSQLAAFLTMMDAAGRNPHYAVALVMK